MKIIACILFATATLVMTGCHSMGSDNNSNTGNSTTPNSSSTTANPDNATGGTAMPDNGNGAAHH